MSQLFTISPYLSWEIVCVWGRGKTLRKDNSCESTLAIYMNRIEPHCWVKISKMKRQNVVWAACDFSSTIVCKGALATLTNPAGKRIAPGWVWYVQTFCTHTRWWKGRDKKRRRHLSFPLRHFHSLWLQPQREYMEKEEKANVVISIFIRSFVS